MLTFIRCRWFTLPALSTKHLDEEKNFKLKPDLKLVLDHKPVIADTKYQIVYADETDPNKGISQPYLYQMLAYAIRFKVEEIVLFYPNTIHKEIPNNSELSIVDELAEGKRIHIRSFQLPIINFNLFDKDFESKSTLVLDFEQTKKDLIVSILKALDIG